MLAPAGSFKNLIAAVEAGCDAVYLGLQEFSMRAFAKNFKIKDLEKIKKICKPQNVKIYLTLNTIIYDNELKKLERIIKKVKDKVDAIICWDMAVINLCRKYKIPFHVSTQASVSNSETARFYKNLGAERIILARELNLKQIKKIHKENPDITLESFVHGAMCVAVSGRCFTSQFLQNLSANRGECAHPCRRSYTITDPDGHQLKLQNNRVMSAKDLCTLPFIDKLKKAGIKSFKIEGRARSPEYVYNVVKQYRKALDKKLTKQEIQQAIKELRKVYNRGFSSGFYIKIPMSDSFSASENGEQTETKEYIARIEKYWPKPKSASVKIHHKTLKPEQEIYIIGDKTGVIRTKIKSIQIENKNIKTAKKGQEVGIKFETQKRLRKNDEIYAIRKK